ncbi:MAG: hypothetical protein IPP74_15510 [Alphaproteobacteria bacterium]|nr:hypothetical protein [Alphaproteobacteria bacterium]
MSDNTQPVQPITEPVAVTPPAPQAPDHENLLREMNELRATAKAAQEQLRLEQDAKLREKKDWETLANKYQKERDDVASQNTRIKEALVIDKKASAVREAAAKLGILPEATGDLDLVDLNGVQIETTSTGKINVLGADKFAEKLKMLKPHWFRPLNPSVNSGGVRIEAGGADITVKDVMNAEKEARKTGDSTKYKALYAQFQKQKQ